MRGLALFAVVVLPIFAYGACISFIVGSIIPRPYADGFVFSLVFMVLYGAFIAYNCRQVIPHD